MFTKELRLYLKLIWKLLSVYHGFSWAVNHQTLDSFNGLKHFILINQFLYSHQILSIVCKVQFNTNLIKSSLFSFHLQIAFMQKQYKLGIQWLPDLELSEQQNGNYISFLFLNKVLQKSYLVSWFEIPYCF